MSATCVPWCVLRGHTGLSEHGDPIFFALLPLNQNLPRVRTGGRGVGAEGHGFGHC